VLNRVNQRILSLSLLAGILGTIAVNPVSSFDPINPVKVLVISSLAFVILGLIAAKRIMKLRNPTPIEGYLFFIFIGFLSMPLFFASAPLQQQFWGVFGRNTGYLTYFALAIIALGVAQTRDVNLERRVVKAFLLTGIVVSAYGLVQAANLEFIGWSQKNVFATLGNVNFFSAFLGISLVVNFTLLVRWKDLQNSALALLLALLFAVQVFLVVETDSIQGIVTAALGILISIFMIARGMRIISPNKLLIFGSSLIATAGTLGFKGLFGEGPLSKFLGQDSNFFRFDYMHAAIEMTKKNPFIGVGLDSYDNWYRTERGFVSAYRTGINRSSNSAHNIYLDLSSGGGIFLLISYLSILSLVLARFFILLKKDYQFSTFQIALFCGWTAYQFQALLSINQVGLGVWGWIFTGALLSFLGRENQNQSEEISANTNISRLKGKSSRSQNKNLNVLPPLAAIFAVLGLVIGFTLAYTPFATDVAFRKAFDSRDVSQMSVVTSRPGSNAFQLAKTLEGAISTGNNGEILRLARDLTQKYPREIFGWDVLRRSPSLSSNEVDLAIKKLEKIDPNIFCFSANPVAEFLRAFDLLTLKQQYELLGWWGFVERRSNASQVKLNLIRQSSDFQGFAASICG
jgi:O-antigen ligase